MVFYSAPDFAKRLGGDLDRIVDGLRLLFKQMRTPRAAAASAGVTLDALKTL